MRTWFLLATLALPSAAWATQPATSALGPDCSLARRAYDNPFSDSRGWSMRRYQWHGFYAGLSTLAAYGIHKTTIL